MLNADSITATTHALTVRSRLVLPESPCRLLIPAAVLVWVEETTVGSARFLVWVTPVFSMFGSFLPVSFAVGRSQPAGHRASISEGRTLGLSLDT
jgi:hypothetical protein